MKSSGYYLSLVGAALILLAGCGNNGGTALVGSTPTPTPPPPSPTPTPAAISLLVTEQSEGVTVTGGGGIVLVDGLPAGKVRTDGTFSALVAPGNHNVSVLDSGARGDVVVNIVAGAVVNVSIAMADSDAAFAPSSVQIPQLASGVFPFPAKTNNPVTVAYFDVAVKPIVVTTITAAYLTTPTKSVDLGPFSTVTAGGNASIDLVSALNTLGGDPATIAANGPFAIELAVGGADGTPYAAKQVFELGIHTVTGHVAAPPSAPSLPVAGMQLSFKKHSSSISFQLTSAADGSFSASGVVSGQYEVSGSVASAGITYSISGTSLIQSSVNLALVPVGPIDLVNNVTSVTTTVIPGAAVVHSPTSLKSDFPRQPPRRSLARSTASVVPGTGPFGNAISVTAGAQDQRVTATAVFTIPKGTASIAVIYQVCSEEFPVFVEAQSQFNDLWSILAVDDHGQQLVNDSHNVNEQLTSPPVWQGDGCTAVIQPVTDVSGSTSTGPISVTVSISATNIGDSILPTSVQAIVAPPGNFSIDTFQLDFIKFVPVHTPKNDNTSNIEVVQNANEGDYISIPSAGKLNTFKRPATATLKFPANNPVTVTNVELDVVDLSGTVLDTVFNQAPGGQATLTNATTLKFPITYVSSTPGGSLLSVLPDRISYLLTVTGTQSGNPVSATQNLTVFNTLWPAIDEGVAVPRYGARDLGGDDWAIQSTVNWIKANANLLTRFDDISGEHGRNIGHAAHGQGTNVDIFHFTSLNSASGLQNYNALRDAAVKAAGGDAPSIQTVAGWILDNRKGIDSLNLNPDVDGTITGLGDAFGTLKGGWLKEAMLFGRLPLTNGTTKDLGLGAVAAWTPSPTPQFRNDHNSHVHVTLNF